MSKSRKANITKLNENDRRIIDKYTGFYTNFIESNTADSGLHKTEKTEPSS